MYPRIFLTFAVLLILVNFGVGQSLTGVINVSVRTKRGENIAGLSKENFYLSQDGEQLQIDSFIDKGEPASIGILIDGSESLQKLDYLALSRGLERFIQNRSPDDRYLVGRFTDKLETIALPTSDTARLKAAFEVVRDTRPAKETAFHLSLIEVIKQLAAETTKRKALIVITDGLDNQLGKAYPRLREALRQTTIPVFLICPKGSGDESHPLLSQAKLFMQDMADISGGYISYFEKNANLTVLMKDISERIDDQYWIVFERKGPRRSGWQPIDVKVSLPNTLQMKGKPIVVTRSGYYFQ